jgi:hypothetical protein
MNITRFWTDIIFVPQQFGYTVKCCINRKLLVFDILIPWETISLSLFISLQIWFYTRAFQTHGHRKMCTFTRNELLSIKLRSGNEKTFYLDVRYYNYKIRKPSHLTRTLYRFVLKFYRYIQPSNIFYFILKLCVPLREERCPAHGQCTRSHAHVFLDHVKMFATHTNQQGCPSISFKLFLHACITKTNMSTRFLITISARTDKYRNTPSSAESKTTMPQWCAREKE